MEKDQGLDLLIEAAALAPRDILFILAGNGMYKPNLKREVKQKALSNVLFLDGVHPQQLIDLYQTADCLYVGIPPFRWHQYGAGYDSYPVGNVQRCAGNLRRRNP